VHAGGRARWGPMARGDDVGSRSGWPSRVPTSRPRARSSLAPTDNRDSGDRIMSGLLPGTRPCPRAGLWVSGRARSWVGQRVAVVVVGTRVRACACALAWHGGGGGGGARKAAEQRSLVAAADPMVAKTLTPPPCAQCPRRLWAARTRHPLGPTAPHHACPT